LSFDYFVEDGAFALSSGVESSAGRRFYHIERAQLHGRRLDALDPTCKDRVG
jgi:hypothetical protein